MDQFEEKLREAMRREPPSNGFASRVLARAAQQDAARRSRSWFHVPQWRWALAVALLTITAVTLTYRRQQQERAQGEAAKQQVMTALRITSAKIQLAQSKVQHLSNR
jgi:anti-sigma-K factor RskA